MTKTKIFLLTKTKTKDEGRLTNYEMYRLLFDILRCVVNDDSIEQERLRGLSPTEWEELYRLGKRQGVTGVLFEKIQVLPKEVAPPKRHVLKWMSHTLSIEKQTKSIYARCTDFAALMREHGLQMLVLKGGAVSQYYPNPWHREFGDLDCYLYRVVDGKVVWDGCYEEGNCIAEQAGYEVKRGHYKHSHIKYCGLEVENHQFSLPIKDGKSTKVLERHLRCLIEESGGGKLINGSSQYCPTADFNALFLTAHAMSHFLYESIKIRHVMDWALFLKAEQDNVDWESFWQWCDRMHYTRFVQCLNYICDCYLGVQIAAFAVAEDKTTKRLAARILQDIFEGDSLYTKGYKGLRFRLALAGTYFKSMWKFHQVYQQSALWLLAKRAVGMLVKKVAV